jgi:predicted kinase
VFSALHDLLLRRLATGAQTTYIDATNLTKYFRRLLLRIAQEFRCAAEALYFDVPLEVCLERNRRRENLLTGPLRDARVVPEEAIRRMARRLEPPTREEGFSRVVVVRPRAIRGAAIRGAAIRPGVVRSEAARPVAVRSRSAKSRIAGRRGNKV